jgi:hypothetical protein
MDQAREAVRNRPALDERWKLALGHRFHLIDAIDGSGRASIVLARYIDLERPVALRIAPWPAGSVGATLIEDEARTLAQLHHPGITRILDFGHSQGFSWIALEHLEAKDLATLLDEGGPLPLRRAIEMILAVGEVVTFAHEQGYLHGYLTPRKIFLFPDGSIKTHGFTGERLLPGNPENPARHAVDVRALAGTLTAAAGWPAVVDPTGGAPLPHHLGAILRPEQSRWLDNILRKARSTKPGADGHATVRELCEDLDVFLDFVPQDPAADGRREGSLRKRPVPAEVADPAPEPVPEIGSGRRSGTPAPRRDDPVEPGKSRIDLLGRGRRKSATGGGDDLDLAPTLIRLGYTIFPSTAALAGCYMLHEEVSVLRMLLVIALHACCFMLVVNTWTEEKG